QPRDRLALGRMLAPNLRALTSLRAWAGLALLLRLRLLRRFCRRCFFCGRRFCGSFGHGLGLRLGDGLRSEPLRGRFLDRRLFGHDLVVLLPCGLLLVGHQICPAFASRSTRTVRIRAISRFASFSRALFSSAPVADWKRRLNNSWRRSCNAFSSSSSLMSLRS